ncbi:MAG: aminoglycoside adenylyltransferase domain-containing protein [Pseudomonadota bacterium]
MSLSPDPLQTDSSIAAYLEEVVRIQSELLGNDLTALFLHGSLVQDDYRPGSSDIDILGAVSRPISAEQRSDLVARLKHETLRVPAHGLELIRCKRDDLRAPTACVPYDFALSTGQEWGLRVETEGATSDILVHMQLCRQSGIALAGPAASEVFGQVPCEWLRIGLLGELQWHREDLQTNPTGQAIANAVLNAARSLQAAETGTILSKTGGALWWLSRWPQDAAVAMAMDYRSGRTTKAPSLRLALEFVRSAIAAIQ